ncbi:MAG: CRTAC1 family protein [Acidobacteria bacterium]|nr:CRTAC1 family protein [Acidobacteriota bacterium]
MSPSAVRRPASVALAVVVTALPAACGGGRHSAPAAGEADAWFVDRAAETGLDFVHFNGMSGEFYLAEIIAPGAALFDYDNDGDLDVYLVQGEMLGGTSLDQALQPPTVPLPLKHRLYRNDLQVHADGTRALRVTDVTEQSGIDIRSYGMGVAAGDVNNDGWVDLYVTRLGPNIMLRNNGNGTFTDVSRESGTDDPGWGVSASFVDIDRDGWLDLFVGNYLTYSVETDADCAGPSGAPDYCPPGNYRAQADRLYRNRGDGTFEDVSAASRIATRSGPALGVTTADFNGDGWIDIYVANDADENQLWINQRNGTFENTALRAGAALSEVGRPEASMGVDAGDVDNDGDEDLFMTHLTAEGHNLYVNDGSATFEDRSARSGLGPFGLAYTGFGTAWIDYDNDGWLDVLTVNGAVHTIERLLLAGDPFPLHQPKQLFRNLGTGRFEDVTARAGAVFQTSDVGRGAAFGDIDNDGDVDVLVTTNNGPVRLLINEVGHRSHWIGVRLLGGASAPLPSTRSGRPELLEGRDMLGARVGIVRADGLTLWRRARSDGSYASANDPRVLAGLGTSRDPVTLRVRWPSGREEEWSGVGIDRWITLTEGTGP